MPVTLVSIGQDFLIVAPSASPSQSDQPVCFRLSQVIGWTPEAYGCAVRTSHDTLLCGCSSSELLEAISPTEQSEPVIEPTLEERKALLEAKQARANQLLMRSAG